MTVYIYYCERDNQLVYPPEPVLKDVQDKISKTLLSCPAFTNHIKNTFVIKAPFPYDLRWDKKDFLFTTETRDQPFFDKNVTVRDVETGFCSFLAPKYFFYAERPLLMRQQPAQYHSNLFSDGITLVSGEYDIGQHFRKMEASFYFKKEKIQIKTGDALYYLKFCTSEKIKFIPFVFTQELANIVEPILDLRHDTNRNRLNFWYKIHNTFYRKTILKLIKQNLMV